jgi:hypothetical protein
MSALPEETLDLIDRFFRGELTEADQAAFAKVRLQAGVGEELTFRQDLMQASKAVGRATLRADMLSWDRAVPQTKRRSLWQRPAVAVGMAAAFALLFAVWLWPSPAQPLSGEELFAAHFSPYPNLLSLQIRGGEASDELLDQSMAAYQEGEYAAAIRGFSRIETPELQPEIAFYLGVSYLGNKQAAEALQSFQLAQEGRFEQASAWYLVLTQIQLEAWDEARKQAEVIAAQADHPQQAQAIVLLKELER